MSEVKVEIKADTSMLATGLAKAQKNIESFGKDITSNITDKLAGAFAGGAVLAGLGMLASGIVQAGKDVLNFAGDLQDTSEALGVTAEQLQGLQASFLMGGAGAEDVKKSLGKLNQAMSDAQQNLGPARDAFDKLGVSFDTIASGDTNAVLMEIANGVKNSTNPTQAFAAALDLLGKSGIKMIPGLKGGADGIKELSDAASKLKDKQVADLAAIGDKIDWLSAKWLTFKAGFFLGNPTQNTQGGEAASMSFVGSGFDPSKFKGPSGIAPSASEFYGPTMAELTAPVVEDPKKKAAEEAQAKMDDENQKKADAYAEKQQAAADKIADVEMSNAQEIEKQRRDQLDTEGQINALLEDRKNLQSEIASSSGMQKAQAQKDLINVEKDLATARAKGIDERIAEGEAMEKDIQAKEKQAEEAKKKKEDVRDAQIGQAEKELDLRTATKARQDSIIEQMADEEMKTPMQRANEDRVAREKERIQNSLRRRIDAGKLSGKSSKAMEKLQMEFDASEKTLEKEVEKLTNELKQVVNKINKG